MSFGWPSDGKAPIYVVTNSDFGSIKTKYSVELKKEKVFCKQHDEKRKYDMRILS